MPYTAIVLVGLPGMGKTAVATQVAVFIPQMVVIEQDQFYRHGKSDPQAYLHAIETELQSHHVVLSKNHHTKKSLAQVTELLQRHHVRYLIFNFVPAQMTTMSLDQQNEMIQVLLDRIEQRTDRSSHLVITTDPKQSRTRAKQIIVHGFLKAYEPPTEPYFQLYYEAPVCDTVAFIIACFTYYR